MRRVIAAEVPDTVTLEEIERALQDLGARRVKEYATKRCQNCSASQYGHKDHVHTAPCPFGDCGAFKEATR